MVFVGMCTGRPKSIATRRATRTRSPKPTSASSASPLWLAVSAIPGSQDCGSSTSRASTRSAVPAHLTALTTDRSARNAVPLGNQLESLDAACAAQEPRTDLVRGFQPALFVSSLGVESGVLDRNARLSGEYDEDLLVFARE